MKYEEKMFVSGNEAVALGVCLSRPHVISAYPITPQTVVVERLSELVEDGSIDADFMHVESEHSALSAAMGSSAVGARTFTATSSQGLLYMAECLHYASGGRFPIVMMNANRSLALPWSIYGDLRDSLSLLDSGWIQVYVEDAQEALDMIIQGYKIAEHKDVLTPFMVNLDGFVLTHTYELVQVPNQQEVDHFLPPFETVNKMALDAPKSLGFSSTPQDNLEFKYQQHMAMMKSIEIIEASDREFGQRFGRTYGGMVDAYKCEDADAVLITLGSITGTARIVIDQLREEGLKVGLFKIRYMRPFPVNEIRELGRKVKAIGVLDKDISFGYEGTIFTNVNSALVGPDSPKVTMNFVGGFGGRNISKAEIAKMFHDLLFAMKGKPYDRVNFVNLGVKTNEIRK